MVKEKKLPRNIYLRGNIYWIKYYRNGKRYYESSESTSITKAKVLLKQREGRIAEGKEPGVIVKKTTFDELAKDLLYDYKVNGKKSLWRAENSVKHLSKYFEGFRAQAIITTRINEYIDKRHEEGVSNSTINRELAALKRMFNLGKQHTPPKVLSIPHIPMLEENNVRSGFFEHGEFLKLRARLPKYLYGVITLGYKYGFRKSEIIGLTWDKVNREEWFILLDPVDTKNNEPRMVYLDKECQEIINGLWEGRKKLKVVLPYVFPNKSGNGIITDFRKAWDSACKDLGIGGKLFHDLRRTAVRNMIRAGIPEKVAMSISGHKTRSIFDRYNIVSIADLKNATNTIKEHLEKLNGDKMGTVAPISKKNRSRMAPK